MPPGTRIGVVMEPKPIPMHRKDDLVLDEATKKLLESITGQNWDKPIKVFSYLEDDED